MKKIGKISVIAFALLLTIVLSAGLSLPTFAASDSSGELPVPETAAAEQSAAAVNNSDVPVTAEPVTTEETTQDTVVVEPPKSNPTPKTSPSSGDDDDGGGWFSWLLDGIKKFFKGLWTDITNIPGNIVNKFFTFLEDWIGINHGRQGLLDILKGGGSGYASEALNGIINALYDVFYIPGIVIMIICFCYALFKGYYSLGLGDRNSIIKPVVGMIIALFAFMMAKDLMTALFSAGLSLTDKIVDVARQSGGGTHWGSYVSNLGYGIVNGILELILMLNIAKIALLQCTAPLYIGFAAAENSRKVMMNFVKEYAKCCLVPPITATYAIATFCICDSTWKLFGSIILGISIWSIASKHLDKIFN